MLRESPAQLVRHLQHPNGWWRDMAQQLLVLTQDRSVVPTLTAMARRDTMLVARFHALWTLEGLGALDAALVREQMKDPNPRMRIQAIRASESLYKAGDRSFAADYRALTQDPDANVAIQAMMTVNTAQGARRARRSSARRRRRTGARGVQLVGRAAPQAAHGAGSRAGQRLVLAGAARAAGEGRHDLPRAVLAVPRRRRDGHSRGRRPAIAPALAGSPRVQGHPDYVIRTLLHGLTGPIDGKTLSPAGSWCRCARTTTTGSPRSRRTCGTRSATWRRPSSPQQVARGARRHREPHDGVDVRRARGVGAARASAVARVEGDGEPCAGDRGARAVRAGLVERQRTARGNVAPGGAARAGAAHRDPLRLAAALPARLLRAPDRQAAARSADVRARLSREVSMDGRDVEPGRAGYRPPSTAITFTPTRAKLVRITLTADAENALPWNVQTLRLWELPPSGTR